MSFMKVEDLKKDFLTLKIDDYITKKKLFMNSQMNGWILLKENESVKVYFLYTRAWDPDTSKTYEDLVYYPNEPIEVDTLKEILLLEAQSIKNHEEKEVVLFLKAA